MSEDELKKLINFNDEYESKLALPNELFKQIQTMVSQGKLKPTHCGFVWSYVYFMTYLFRYAKYSCYTPTTSEIKEVLGFSGTNQKLDYIIKKNGLLEELNILTTIHDFPVVVEPEDDILIFDYAGRLYGVKEWLKFNKLSLNYSCKYPVFGFHRDNDEDLDGTFYFTHNVLLLPFNVFAYCMSNKELGVNAFYFWSWLKYKNDLHSEGYCATRSKMSSELSLSETTIQRLINKMRSYKMITVCHNIEYFSFGLDEEERKANSYTVNDYEYFTYEKVSYEKIKYLTKEQHEEIKKLNGEISVVELFS